MKSIASETMAAAREHSHSDDDTQLMVEAIISGGQTGVDRAALDAARKLGIPHAGWCPRGRRAEDGPIAPEYRLQETDSEDYQVRTEWNVRDSDATLVLNQGRLEGGTAATVRFAHQYDRPCRVVDLEHPAVPAAVRDWLNQHEIKRLNVAGPRESKRPGVYRLACDYLLRILGEN